MGLADLVKFVCCFPKEDEEEPDSPTSVSSLVVARDDPNLPIVYLAGRVGNPRIKAKWSATPRQRMRRARGSPMP